LEKENIFLTILKTSPNSVLWLPRILQGHPNPAKSEASQIRKTLDDINFSKIEISILNKEKELSMSG